MSERFSMDLDAKVAELMGWEWVDQHGMQILIPPADDPRRGWTAQWDELGRPHWLPAFSSEMREAWPVAVKYGLTVMPVDGKWLAGRFRGYLDESMGIVDGALDPGTLEGTAQLAICLAALDIGVLR